MFLPGFFRTIAPSLIVATSVGVIALSPARAQQPAAELSLDSLLSTPINSAAKYEQTVRQAAASVTILTSDDLRRFGFRNLEEALGSIRGFYTTNDHNYSYLGARGFSRPSDYNNRMLLLVNGHALNEQVWGSAPVGSDFMVNLDAVERIEVVRGPGSVIYGSNAMFGVINVVMKSAEQHSGVTVSARGGSGASRQAGISVGGTAGRGFTFSASALVAREDGGQLFFSEFDDPGTGNGIVDGLDWERGGGGHATMAWGGLSLSLGSLTRAKGIPTASYGTLFGDARSRTLDEHRWAELALVRHIGSAMRATGRVYGNTFRYYGSYPTDAGDPYQDRGYSDMGGVEGLLVWDQSSRSRFLFGGEGRRVSRAENATLEAGVRDSDNAPFSTLGVFAQNEFSLTPRVSFHSGVSLDMRSDATPALSRRLALLLAPDARTSVKLLYGRAFRGPSPSEFAYDNPYYVPNPELRPERIRTMEIEGQRQLSALLLLTASVYHNTIRGLTEPVLVVDDRAQYINLGSVDAAGVELEADVRPAGPLAARTTFALQQTRNRADKSTLSNSPGSVGTFTLMSRDVTGLFGAATFRYESGRRTLAGPATDAFTRTDVNVGYATDPDRSALRGLELSLRVTNLFDVRYLAPGGLEHTQSAIEQQRRAVALRLSTRF